MGAQRTLDIKRERRMAKLTEMRARDASLPTAGERTDWDSELRGLGLRLRASGSRNWIVKYRNATGRQRKATLGPWPAVTADAARREARRILGAVAAGHDPVADQRRQHESRVTLATAVADYLEARHRLKPDTVVDYRRAVAQMFNDWADRPLAAITSDAVLARHREITERAGPGAANFSLRVLGAVYSFAMAKYLAEDGEPLFVRNPVKALSAFKAWNRLERRQTVVREHELPAWWRAVQALESATARDYLVLVLLTGLRRREAAGLSWNDVDIPGRTLTISAARAKNGHAHTLPLGPFLLELLKRRRASALGALVFPSARGDASQIATAELTARVAEASGVRFTVHDLRRTFASIAESLDVPAYALRRLLNHAGSDVTSGYLIFNDERLRKPTEAVERYVLSAVGATSSNVSELRHVEVKTPR
jgi:integrase